MKIHQLLDACPIIVTNEEQSFIDRHDSRIPLHALLDRDEILARNLVRKGIYEMSSDSRYLVLKPRPNKTNNA